MKKRFYAVMAAFLSILIVSSSTVVPAFAGGSGDWYKTRYCKAKRPIGGGKYSYSTARMDLTNYDMIVAGVKGQQYHIDLDAGWYTGGLVDIRIYTLTTWFDGWDTQITQDFNVTVKDQKSHTITGRWYDYRGLIWACSITV